jgi:polysaccharide biosynthesis protein PslG
MHRNPESVNSAIPALLAQNLDRRTLLRRGASLGLVLPAVSLLLAACGGDDEEEEPTPEPEPEAEQEPEQDPEPEEEPTPEPEPTQEPEPESEPETEDEPEEETEPEEVDEPAEEPVLPDGEPERPQSEFFSYGFNIAWRADEGGQQYNQWTLQTLDTAGFNWARFQIHWSEIQREPEWLDPLPVDRMIDLYEGSGVRLLVSIIGAPDWARHPENTQLLADWERFADVMAFLADRYRGRVHAWGIWNEQNMAHEMHGFVRVSDYAYLLEAGYRGVKEADPDALVVFGGLTPTGVNDPEVAINDVDYLREFYEFEGGAFREYFDVMGAHLNATNNPPDTSYPDNLGPGEWTEHNSFYFLRGRDLHAVMSDYEDGRQVWVTEFGWTTENQAPGYEYGADVSEEAQAEYLVRAFDVAREQMPFITAMFVWNLNFTTLVPPEDEKYPWSVLNADWSPRPAYRALQQMPKP